ncbi:D-sedoheptulose 7-phosphate isomerase [candidate division WOR-3 bacterium]|nr:D-sedoheptulose 7-phosphate isomerase [candidate division WOR-3 bacterium]
MKGSFPQKSFSDALETLENFIKNSINIKKTEETSLALAKCFKSGKKALICGNGGSLCDAMHFAEEFTGRYRKNRKPLPVISISDSSHITCVGNDYGFDHVFSRGVEAFGREGDVFIGLSTSGNSPNIIKAHEEAKKIGMKTVLLLGKDGGDLSGKADIEFIVGGATSDRIQEVHMTVLHIVIEGVERIIFPENYE